MLKKQTSFILLLLISFFVVLGIVTCTKEYSYEGGAPATYTFTGTPAECTNAVVNGSYAAQTPADTTDNVQLEVHVTVPGNYSIITNSVNGLSFAASGSFADTGIFNVVLKAAGTPVAEGSFQFQIPGTGGCFFMIDVTKKLTADFMLAGAPYNCESPALNGTYIQGTTLDASNSIVVNVAVNVAGDYTITTDTTDGVFFSASGNFASAGTQQVTLKGSGRPNDAGLIYFHVSGDSTACDFELPVYNYSPFATYVLESGFNTNGNAPCTPQMVNGGYTKDVALNINNTVEITAYATIAGNYTISTDSINGMIFTATGSLLEGRQPVTLQGYGKPNATGEFLCQPRIIGPAPLGGESCGFIINVK